MDITAHQITMTFVILILSFIGWLACQVMVYEFRSWRMNKQSPDRKNDEYGNPGR